MPISRAANLQPGDRIWIHPDFPESQSVHYLLIVAFLRGTTNPPPENWFTRVETWNKNVRTEGIVVTVPPDGSAGAAVSGAGDGRRFFHSALRGSRTARKLRESLAGFESSESGTFAPRQVLERDSSKRPIASRKRFSERSEALARTLNIKVDQGCFYKPEEQQAPCLMQNTDQLVLDDGHTQSMVAALTAGPSTDLIGAVSATPLAGGGSFSPYVGAIVDMARIMGTLHTAEYQYIPALALPRQRHLNLRLNSPPSFRNPKSVLVVGLPAVEAPQLPPLRAVNPDEVFCLQKTSLVLPVQGAPLVFSTTIAHDFVLRVPVANAGKRSICRQPPTPRTADLRSTLMPCRRERRNHRSKGRFAASGDSKPIEGPSFNCVRRTPGSGRFRPRIRSALIVDREDMLHLESECAVCVDQVTIERCTGEKSECHVEDCEAGRTGSESAAKGRSGGTGQSEE